jgi:hypothetical protein
MQESKAAIGAAAPDGGRTMRRTIPLTLALLVVMVGAVFAATAVAEVTAPKLRPPAMSGDRHVVGVANVPRGWSATLVLSGPAGENVQQSTTNGGKLVVASVCDPNAGFGPFAWETQLTYTKPGHDPETLRKVRLLACR